MYLSQLQRLVQGISRWVRGDGNLQNFQDIQEGGGNPPPAQEGAPDNSPWARRGSVVCGVTEGILGLLLALLGEAGPSRGESLDRSGSMFDGVSAQIATLDPDGGWRGNAARAYGAKNLAQSQHTTLVADLDRLTGELVSSQADAVKRARDLLSAEIWIVLVLLVVCIGLELHGPEGQILSFHIAIPICTMAVFTAATALGVLAATTSQNASAVQAATQRLAAMMAALTTGSDTVAGPPEITMPPTPSLSEFDLADSSAASSHIPDLSSDFTDLPGAPEFHLATGAGVGFPDFGAPQLPITALTGLPTLPTIAQLSTTLSQLTNLAGPTSAVSQPAQHHTTPADHRTRNDATNTPDTATTTSGERAPLDSTTHPTQQHQKLAV
ncbi:EspA/EspE family type VII secretion system effector [Mycobacterium marinum]|uniref:EspA/EspE family type VII secretion system effector n=1 Tax=Mycobacterium marinum TaxID=1781 RepID=UPI0035638DBA